MERSEHYESDLLFFFDGKPLELRLYQALFRQLDALFPEGSVRVQKSQISCREGEVSREPEVKVEVTCRRDRAAETVAAVKRVHPYEEPVINVIPLLGWFREAWDFAESKR